MTDSPLMLARRIATEGLSFRIPRGRGLFLPRDIANAFFACGHDDLPNQDVLEWPPFTLSEEDYRSFFAWWKVSHPDARIDRLGVRGADFASWFRAAVDQPAAGR